MMTHFRTRRKTDGIYLAASEDGLCWTPLAGDRPVLLPHPDAEYIADPFFAPDADGIYHVVYTTSWGQLPGETRYPVHATFGYAATGNFREWRDHRVISVERGELVHGDVRNCWAPKLFRDDRVGEFLVLFSASRRTLPNLATMFKGDHAIYVMRTRDFVSFSDPVPFFGAQFSNNALIDCFVMEEGGRYHAFVKVEADDLSGAGEKRGLHHTTSMSLDGPWEPLRPIPGAGGRTEGPFVLHAGEHWLLYGDAPYYLGRSTDLEHWVPATADLSYPAGYTHGTAKPVPDALCR